MKNHAGFRILAAFMGIYHLGMGIFGSFSGDMASKVANVMWGAHVVIDPQFSYMAKFLGAYVIAFGLMMLFIAKDPVRYSSLVYVAVVLAVIRILNRVVFSGDLHAAFSIAPSRMIGTIIGVALLNLGLLLLKPKAAEAAAN